MDSLRTELQENQRAKIEAEASNRQLNDKIQAVESRISTLRSEADALRAENESLRNGTYAAQSNSEGLSIELSIARSVAESAERENLQLQTTVFKQEETIKRLQENTQILEARVQTLTSSSNIDSSLKEQLQQSQRKIAQLEESNYEITQQLQEAERSAVSAASAAEALR
jgi:chromosome segregation ATPase